ncbi:MAG: hypothetical protein COW76_20520 [Shewanella sp. CG18_big_fil_WC_8_21_14_2_50_42_11]|uniref:phage tail terminator protein n=1 Tax=Shewanella sp. CG18_big_fil_WC_8_21_14_2_50_42_11 TaxID=1975538 RepID=UPI000C60ED1A|nr:hypothetical protein [Shewanella sp. CG18_big_fil_WC_8_21_14_2_50_42_11]PIP98549.1 MAG: hypothetical protein COW76_20520 [Shewanella sp. CG18_big_fil_WC_8_21_14_2_50_42_11]
MDVVQQMQAKLTATGEFATVEDSVALTELTAKSIRGQTAVWVGELSSLPDQNVRDIGDPVQFEDQVFGVVIGVRSVNDRHGSAAKETLTPKRLIVRQQFFGWTPDGFDPFVLGGAELLVFANGALFWVERFRTRRMITKEDLL